MNNAIFLMLLFGPFVLLVMWVGYCIEPSNPPFPIAAAVDIRTPVAVTPEYDGAPCTLVAGTRVRVMHYYGFSASPQRVRVQLENLPPLYSGVYDNRCSFGMATIPVSELAHAWRLQSESR